MRQCWPTQLLNLWSCSPPIMMGEHDSDTPWDGDHRALGWRFIRLPSRRARYGTSSDVVGIHIHLLLRDLQLAEFTISSVMSSPLRRHRGVSSNVRGCRGGPLRRTRDHVPRKQYRNTALARETCLPAVFLSTTTFLPMVRLTLFTISARESVTWTSSSRVPDSLKNPYHTVGVSCLHD
ncbi:hypothetical protein PYCCODRAFT_383236 [Trametes coccinea BRFM310]|uniref:Uncharacterized protein n=1 Tax=Trametes coccinea (strain BRFM310) TaxID=1353009 RepID=A0A1Y2J597_TRAC3|nr:hypothetical protein PYCCODRAFT_383236 [Trametes coccinea BRFM310]